MTKRAAASLRLQKGKQVHFRNSEVCADGKGPKKPPSPKKLSYVGFPAKAGYASNLKVFPNVPKWGPLVPIAAIT